MVFFKKRVGSTKKLVQKTLTAFPASCTTEQIQSSTIPFAQAAVGKGADHAVVNGDFYSSGSDVIGTVTYGFDLAQIPADATFVSLECRVKGGREISSSGQCVAAVYTYDADQNEIIMGSPAIFTEIISSVKTITYAREIAMSYVKNLVLGITVARRGGHIDGATLTITYEVYE